MNHSKYLFLSRVLESSIAGLHNCIPSRLLQQSDFVFFIMKRKEYRAKYYIGGDKHLTTADFNSMLPLEYFTVVQYLYLLISIS